MFAQAFSFRLINLFLSINDPQKIVLIPQQFYERFCIHHQSLNVRHHINKQLQWATLYVTKQTMSILKEWI